MATGSRVGVGVGLGVGVDVGVGDGLGDAAGTALGAHAARVSASNAITATAAFPLRIVPL